MNTLRNEKGKVRINKITPLNVNIKAVEYIISEFTNEANAKKLASLFINLISGNEDILVLERNSEISQVIVDYIGFRIDRCKKASDFEELVMATGLSRDIAHRCTIATFLDFKNIMYDDAIFLQKQKEEMKKRQEIAKETPTWIPNGYKQVEGDMMSGIVISDRHGNEFTYIPYMEVYISRYEISQDEYGCAKSVAGEKAWVNIDGKHARKVARQFDPNANSDLVNDIAAIKESIYRKTGNVFPDIVYDGSAEIRTGGIPENMIYNIDCLTGNHYCILKEPFNCMKNSFSIDGYAYNETKISYSLSEKYIIKGNKFTGFRICLYRG